MAGEYKVYVVNFNEGSVVDETFDPLYTREEAIRRADEFVASDRNDNSTGLGYEVVVSETERISRVVYWTLVRVNHPGISRTHGRGLLTHTRAGAPALFVP